ncbi:MAG: hypothetical protein Q9190_000601 [Brigantiaea leucoxantha]
MCWPSVEGGIQVEERYPRTNDPREPRRKRLHFVRDKSSSPRSSDEWALTRSSFNTTRPRRHNEMQERERWENQQRLMHAEQQRQQLEWQNMQQRQQLQEMAQQRHQLQAMAQQRQLEQQQHPHPGYGPPPPPPPPLGGGHPHDPHRMMHPGHPHDIESVEEFHPHTGARVIEAAPRSPLPRHVRTIRGRSPSRTRSHGHRPPHHSGGSIFSDDTSDSYPVRRRPSRRRRDPFYYASSDDSFDDLRFPVRRVISVPRR